jgi:hypothetical protein
MKARKRSTAKMDNSHRKDDLLGSSSAKPIVLEEDDDDDDALELEGRQRSKKSTRPKKARMPNITVSCPPKIPDSIGTCICLLHVINEFI